MHAMCLHPATEITNDYSQNDIPLFTVCELDHSGSELFNWPCEELTMVDILLHNTLTHPKLVFEDGLMPIVRVAKKVHLTGCVHRYFP